MFDFIFNLSLNGKYFSFIEPGSSFFANIIFFHDEVCYYLVLILVFTYFMLYHIIIKHLFNYNIDNYFLNNVDSNFFTDNINFNNNNNTSQKKGTFLFIILKFIFKYNNYYFFFINYYYIFILNFFYNNFNNISFFFEYNDSSFKFFSNILYIFGLDTSINFKNIVDYSFFYESILNNNTNFLYDLNHINKRIFLFSTLNTYYNLDIFGKLLNSTEISVIKNTSIDYNLYSLNNILPILYKSNLDRSYQNYTFDSINTYIIYNYILNVKLNFQENFFYKKKFLYLKNLWNSAIWGIIPKSNSIHLVSFKFYKPEVLNTLLIDLELPYLSILDKVNNFYLNSNIKRRINRDILMHALEFKHATSFEYIWSLFPTIIIILIIGPSYRLLYSGSSYKDSTLTVKVIGHQWYWSYEINSTDFSEINSTIFSENIKFDSHILKFKNEDITKNARFRRLLDVDKSLLIIAHKPINFIITSGDVLHSFAVPAFGLKVDAVPGRINTFFLEGSKVGKYYGQCSELCGSGHGFMPIAIDVVKKNNKLDNFNNISFWNHNNSRDLKISQFYSFLRQRWSSVYEYYSLNK